MKRMLTMLFLLFCLNGTMSLVNSNEIDTSELLTNNNKLTIYNEVLVNKIEENATQAYRHWDGIPVLSPIKIRNINRISSDYGYRNHPIYLKWYMHHGIDISAKQGTFVYSTANGVVTKIKHSNRGYGNEVIITHSNGYSTRYAHLDDILVKKGQKIYANKYIGTVGNTGLSTGSHLHYEILKNNRPIDPMYFTYDSPKNRSIDRYLNSLIVLEGQQFAGNNLTLGMHHTFAANEQVISSTKIN